MKQLFHTLILALIYTSSISAVGANDNGDSPPLVLEHYWMLTGADKLQPSGLSFCGTELVMVSDRHSDMVFSIPLSDKNTAKVNTFRSIPPFKTLPASIGWQEQLMDWGLRWTNKRFDWEGIHCNTDGELYLASESLSAVAKINLNGHSDWVSPSLLIELQKRGFASTLNSGFEGITAHHEHIIIALEREPRGLLRINLHPTPPHIGKVQQINHKAFKSPLPPDFTGLWLEQADHHPPKLYTLERNYFRICRRAYENWAIETCWSYRGTERLPEFTFENNQYGLAEGIARLGEYIYIVLDNNGEFRKQENNHNPLLFKFKRPNNW